MKKVTWSIAYTDGEMPATDIHSKKRAIELAYFEGCKFVVRVKTSKGKLKYKVFAVDDVVTNNTVLRIF